MHSLVDQIEQRIDAVRPLVDTERGAELLHLLERSLYRGSLPLLKKALDLLEDEVTDPDRHEREGV